MVEQIECYSPDGDALGQIVVQLDDPRKHPIPRIEAWQVVNETSRPDEVDQIPLVFISTSGEATFLPCAVNAPVAVWTYPL